MAHLHAWPPGAASLDVEDWDSGATVTVTLADAAAGPIACAKKLYGRAAKQRRASDHLEPLLLEGEHVAAYLREVAESLSQLDR